LELPPHIFGIAEGAYRAMKNDNENQCVIISYERSPYSTSRAGVDPSFYVLPLPAPSLKEVSRALAKLKPPRRS